ncbi:helix-turn-helix transcriptional regulator [Ammoniphilus sp. YIM 78166]|uniref:helix-turn-helix domain-containing protein n=1 Tax=Ammoniphilus sp. YIM 78166 TaxID=1644106 RepID=UPI00106F6331|nr:helix-turn-helix transcriptional regulator [Ammoniphilus sp. YIM 78166]
MRLVRIKIQNLLKKRKMTQMQLSQLTNIRQAAISEMSRNNREKVDLNHLEKIANVLKIDDMNELITIEKTPDQR